jgi:hypothetical protein
MENPKKAKDNLPKNEMDFGMVDLGGQEAAEEKPLAVEHPAPSARVSPAAKTSSPAPPSPAKSTAEETIDIPKSRPPSRYQPLTVTVPPEPLISAAVLKIILLVLIAAGAIGGAIFGLIKWRQHVAEQEIAEKQNLDQRSLDSLREKVIRTESVK